jgi:hypothetical protein
MTTTNPSRTQWNTWVVVWSICRRSSLESFDEGVLGAEVQGMDADMSSVTGPRSKGARGARPLPSRPACHASPSDRRRGR